jgi:integrase
MASVFNRRSAGGDRGTLGTRENPKWIAVYAAGTKSDGKPIWKQKAIPENANVTNKREAQRWADQYERDFKAGKTAEQSAPSPLIGDLIDKWEPTLATRGVRTDRSRIRLHVRPAFADRRLADVGVADLMRWIDQQRAAKDRLSEGSIRHNLGTLSRFYSWCIERGYASVNPCRSITPGSRPKMAGKKDVPYLNDDRVVRRIAEALPEPIGLMFYIGHTSGLRLGEICGLRIADVSLFIDQGLIRASHSYDGPLKEDKLQKGKSKIVPAAADAEATIRPRLNRRLAEGAKPDDYFFPNRMKPRGRRAQSPPPGYYRKEYVDTAWNETMIELGLTKPGDVVKRRGRKVRVDSKTGEPLPVAALSFYEATRHSFASRLLEAGNSLDEVSHALNHSSPEVTKRNYDHFKRTSYSPTMRIGVGFKAPTDGGKVLPMTSAPSRHSAFHSARVDSDENRDEAVDEKSHAMR